MPHSNHLRPYGAASSREKAQSQVITRDFVTDGIKLWTVTPFLPGLDLDLDLDSAAIHGVTVHIFIPSVTKSRVIT